MSKLYADASPDVPVKDNPPDHPPKGPEPRDNPPDHPPKDK